MRRFIPTRNNCIDCMFGEHSIEKQQIYCHYDHNFTELTQCGGYIKAMSIAEIVERAVNRRAQQEYNSIMDEYEVD